VLSVIVAVPAGRMQTPPPWEAEFLDRGLFVIVAVPEAT
jgi:hypothetical protein